MSQKNRVSVSNEQRLFLLRELVSIQSGLNEDLRLEGISDEGRMAVASEVMLVTDLIRKLVRNTKYERGTNY